MKIVKCIYVVAISTVTAGVLVAAPAMAAPGKGWDMFNSGQGDRIGPPASSQPASSGFDMFQMGLGEPVHATGYKAAMQSHAGQGWDMYQTGSGQALR